MVVVVFVVIVAAAAAAVVVVVGRTNYNDNPADDNHKSHEQ